MKKIIIATLVLIASISAKEITVNSKLKYTYINTTFGTKHVKDVSISYSTEKDEYSIAFQGSIDAVVFVFKEAGELGLTNSISKYKEWNKKATDKGMTLTKNINKTTIYNAYFMQFGEWHGGSGDVTYKFISESKKKHYMAILGTIQSDSNQFSKTSIQICLDYRQAIALQKALTVKSLEVYKKKALKKSLEMSEFN